MTGRCTCHPAEYYASCTRCPKCGHWSFDAYTRSCERRTCAYQEPPSLLDQLDNEDVTR